MAAILLCAMAAPASADAERRRQVEREPESDEEEQEYVFLQTLETTIVGVTYYAPRHRAECFKFVSDESKGPNTMRAENQHGETVGHLPRGLVDQIAPLLAEGSLRFGKAVPRPAPLGRDFEIPIAV